MGTMLVNLIKFNWLKQSFVPCIEKVLFRYIFHLETFIEEWCTKALGQIIHIILTIMVALKYKDYEDEYIQIYRIYFDHFFFINMTFVMMMIIFIIVPPWSKLGTTCSWPIWLWWWWWCHHGLNWAPHVPTKRNDLSPFSAASLSLVLLSRHYAYDDMLMILIMI